MRLFIFCCLAVTLLVGCKKENTSKVDIYMLKSFTIGMDQTTTPATRTITDAILEANPLVADDDIVFYKQSTTTFKLRKNIKPIIQNYGPDKAFAVTIDKQPVYFGKVHPGYLSSMTLGLATFDPILFTENNLQINFVSIGTDMISLLRDKRNDDRIIRAMKATGRLK